MDKIVSVKRCKCQIVYRACCIFALSNVVLFSFLGVICIHVFKMKAPLIFKQHSTVSCFRYVTHKYDWDVMNDSLRAAICNVLDT
jgi:hypothetical protein